MFEQLNINSNRPRLGFANSSVTSKSCPHLYQQRTECDESSLFFCLFGHIKGDEQNPSLCTPIWPLRHAVEQDPECENTSPEQADFSCIFIETLCYETSPVHYWTGLLLIFASAVASWLGRPHRCWLVNTDLSKHLVPKAPTWERGWRWCQGNRGPFRLRSGCSGIVWIQSQTAEGIRAFSLKQII